MAFFTPRGSRSLRTRRLRADKRTGTSSRSCSGFTLIEISIALGILSVGLLGVAAATITAMAVSGSFALIIGSMFGTNPLLLTTACVIWGISIIADSAQFSASVAELSEPQMVGTMLTAQTSAGFLLTLITIHLMPVLVGQTGWALAFAILALGPLFGIVAMAKLRKQPDAIKLANGRR